MAHSHERCICYIRDDALRLIPTPTPRWPDLLCVYSPRSRLLFTSKLFAAHVAPSALGAPRDLAHDVGGWDALESDWRYYYDCMLAPVARQAAGRLLWRIIIGGGRYTGPCWIMPLCLSICLMMPYVDADWSLYCPPLTDTKCMWVQLHWRSLRSLPRRPLGRRLCWRRSRQA